MKILKVNLHIIGTIEIQEDEVKKGQQELSFNPEESRMAGAIQQVFAGKSENGKCKLSDCTQPATVRGFCNKHYQVWYKTRKKVSA